MTHSTRAAPLRDGTATAVLALLQSQVQCVLATADRGEPVQHLMAYAFSDTLERVYIASFSETEKVANMLANPAVSLFWDNRTGNTSDHTHGLALAAHGRATLLSADDSQPPKRALLARNASLSDMLNSPAVVVFAVTVDRYRLVRGYQSTIDFVPGHHPTAH